MDWDTFYEEWVEKYGYNDNHPSHEDYTDWLFDKADLALGDG